MIDAVRKIVTIARFYKHRTPFILGRHLAFLAMRHLLGVESVNAHVYGLRMQVPVKSEGIGRALYVYRGRELDHKWILEKVLRSGDVIFDLGANLGYYALLQAQILKKNCRLYCVEPDARNIPFLESNITAHGLDAITRIEQCAISDYEGSGSLIQANRTNLSRLNTGPDHQSKGRSSVAVHDFVTYLQSIPEKVDVVRMDIEGGEISIFRSLVNGHTNGIVFHPPRTIVFETHTYGTRESEMKTLLVDLFRMGYRVQFIASDDELHEKPKLSSFGYRPIHIIEECGVSRGIYQNVSEEDAALLISQWRGTRTICLGKD